MSRVLPILFNTEMVRAILDGRKTVTRRLVKIKYRSDESGFQIVTNKATEVKRVDTVDEDGLAVRTCIEPPYQVGDVLYVRETWCKNPNYDEYYFKTRPFGIAPYGLKWKPSIHMPKEAARIFLRVKDVRVERLKDITEEQAKAEGICRLYDDMSKTEYEAWARRIGRLESQAESSFKNYLWHGNFGSCGCGNKLSDAWEYQCSGYDSAVDSFSSLWNTTVDLKDWVRYGWYANPWVWVIEFERCEKPEEDKNERDSV